MKNETSKYSLSRPIVIIGMMGVGKTTIGKQLSDHLNIKFIDSDWIIEDRCHLTIPDIFEICGEKYFRNKEKEVIKELLTGNAKETKNLGNDYILSLGGGAFMDAESRQIISENAISLWLRADLKTIMERVKKNKNRPLLQQDSPEIVIEQLIEQRYPIYALADITIQTGNTSMGNVINDAKNAIISYNDELVKAEQDE